MTYRNDHDAALHRVDALEGELARLHKEYEAKLASQPTEVVPKRRFIPTWMGTIVIAGAVAATWTCRENRIAKSAQAAEPVVAPVNDKEASLEWLRPCVNAIEKPSIWLDASNTDPHGGARESVATIVRSGASCRAALGAYAKASDDERFVAWSAAEDQLAGAITRIQVYYDSDPYALDHYATAAQLWGEYDEAIIVRDRALKRIR